MPNRTGNTRHPFLLKALVNAEHYNSFIPSPSPSPSPSWIEYPYSIPRLIWYTSSLHCSSTEVSLFPPPCGICASFVMAPELRIQLSSWCQIISIAFFMISFAPTLTMSQICYALNGDYLPTFGTCNNTNFAGVCCRINDACLTNGLCSNSAGNMYRGGCTDQSFHSKACLPMCNGGESDGNLVIGFTLELISNRYNDVLLDSMSEQPHHNRRPVLL